MHELTQRQRARIVCGSGFRVWADEGSQRLWLLGASVSYHANLVPADAELVRHVIEHKGIGLADDFGLPLRGTLDGAHHRTISGPFLRARQMRHRVEIGRNELASLILVDAELRILYLVVCPRTEQSA